MGSWDPRSISGIQFKFGKFKFWFRSLTSTHHHVWVVWSFKAFHYRHPSRPLFPVFILSRNVNQTFEPNNKFSFLQPLHRPQNSPPHNENAALGPIFMYDNRQDCCLIYSIDEDEFNVNSKCRRCKIYWTFRRGEVHQLSDEMSLPTKTAQVTNDLIDSFSGKSRKRRIKGSSPLAKNIDSSNVSIKEKNVEVRDNLPTLIKNASRSWFIILDINCCYQCIFNTEGAW